MNVLPTNQTLLGPTAAAASGLASAWPAGGELRGGRDRYRGPGGAVEVVERGKAAHPHVGRRQGGDRGAGHAAPVWVVAFSAVQVLPFQCRIAPIVVTAYASLGVTASTSVSPPVGELTGTVTLLHEVPLKCSSTGELFRCKPSLNAVPAAQMSDGDDPEIEVMSRPGCVVGTGSLVSVQVPMMWQRKRGRASLHLLPAHPRSQARA